MRRLMFFVGGVACGVMVGAALALLLAPESGDAMRMDAKSRVEEAKLEARRASNNRRAALEAELARLTTASPQETAVARR